MSTVLQGVEAEFAAYLATEAAHMPFTPSKRAQWLAYSQDSAVRAALLTAIRVHAGEAATRWQSLVDVGCGYGNLLCAAAGTFERRAGIDIDAPRVAWASRRDPGGELRVGSASSLPWPDATFDLAVSTDVLEHVEPSLQGRVVAEVARVLQDGGCAYFAVPNRFQIIDEHHRVLFGSWLRGRPRRALLSVATSNAFVPCWERTRAQWLALFAAHGLQPLADLRLVMQTSPAKRAFERLFPQRTCMLLRRGARSPEQLGAAHSGMSSSGGPAGS